MCLRSADHAATGAACRVAASERSPSSSRHRKGPCIEGRQTASSRRSLRACATRMCTCVGLTRPGGGAACALRTHPEACTATCTAAATATASNCQSPARTGARKRTHERTPHSVATNSTSAGSRPSCRGHIPIGRVSCEHTGPPRSNVADGNQQSPPMAATSCADSSGLLRKAMYHSQDRHTLPSHDRHHLREPTSRRCRP